jgi:hypothetical protein
MCSAIVFKLAALLFACEEEVRDEEDQRAHRDARRAAQAAEGEAAADRGAAADAGLPAGTPGGHAAQDPGGAIVLAKVDQGLLEEATLRRWLDGALTRADDRQLFGLRKT